MNKLNCICIDNSTSILSWKLTVGKTYRVLHSDSTTYSNSTQAVNCEAPRYCFEVKDDKNARFMFKTETFSSFFESV